MYSNANMQCQICGRASTTGVTCCNSYCQEASAMLNRTKYARSKKIKEAAAKRAEECITLRG